MVAVGTWDVSLAQALVAEMDERRRGHTQYEQDHGKEWQLSQTDAYKQARDSRKALDNIGWRAYQAIIKYTNGEARLKAYLAQPMLCGYCLNVKEQLSPCRRNCGRQLCPDCMTQSTICPNLGICQQPHPIVWRAGIKLFDHDNSIYKEWQAAADIADAHTEKAGYGRRPATQSA
jgi:hypothetical protein